MQWFVAIRRFILVCLHQCYSSHCVLIGNIVLYSAYFMGAPYAFWNSGTSGKGSPPYSLVMQNDGNLVLYGAGSTVDSSKATWNSNSGGKGKAPYSLTMQDDGKLMHYSILSIE